MVIATNFTTSEHRSIVTSEENTTFQTMTQHLARILGQKTENVFEDNRHQTGVTPPLIQTSFAKTNKGPMSRDSFTREMVPQDVTDSITREMTTRDMVPQEITNSISREMFTREIVPQDITSAITKEMLTREMVSQDITSLVSRDILTSETVPQNITSYNITSTTSSDIVKNLSKTPEITTDSMSYLTNIFKGDITENHNIMPGVDQVPAYNRSSEHLVIYGDSSDGSHLHFKSSFVNDSFSNSTLDYSSLDGFNSTIVYIKSQSPSDTTSFAFDQASWLTLTSLRTSDNVDTYSGDESGDTILILKVVFLAFISIVGSFGNVMVIWSVVKERHLHRPPFYFLLSLGVTDFSRAIFCVPVVITTVLHGSRWRHGESACKLFAFATSFFVFSSALSLLAIAIDRYICIIYSKTYRRRAPGIANLVIAIIIWIIAFSASFPPVVGVGDYVFVPEEAQCTYQHKHYTINGVVSSVFIFLVILLLTFCLYFRIFCFLRSHRRMRPLEHTPAQSTNWAFVGHGANGQAFINWLNGFGGQVPTRQQGQRAVQRLNFGRVINLSTARNEHLTRLFLVLTMVFGILWSPYVVLALWRIFFDASLIPSLSVTVSAWLGYVQIAMCPVVYFMARGPVRKPTRTLYTPSEKKNFLLENKIDK